MLRNLKSNQNAFDNYVIVKSWCTGHLLPMKPKTHPLKIWWKCHMKAKMKTLLC